MENKIEIKLLEGHVIELDTNNPNIDNLITKINNHKEEIKIDKISVSCTNQNFDAEGFKIIIVQCIKEYLDKIKLDLVNYNDTQKSNNDN